jgi:hypothetical protein
MNFMQKRSIADLRGQGFSYAKIAEALRLSENSVKSYCQRNDLGGTRQTDAQIPTKLCAQCAAPMFALNKSKRFCSRKCRMAWWNAHGSPQETEKRKPVICAGCGAEFLAYACKPRKYCSHACYINARFKGGSAHDA